MRSQLAGITAETRMESVAIVPPVSIIEVYRPDRVWRTLPTPAACQAPCRAARECWRGDAARRYNGGVPRAQARAPNAPIISAWAVTGDRGTPCPIAGSQHSESAMQPFPMNTAPPGLDSERDL